MYGSWLWCWFWHTQDRMPTGNKWTASLKNSFLTQILKKWCRLAWYISTLCAILWPKYKKLLSSIQWCISSGCFVKMYFNKGWIKLKANWRWRAVDSPKNKLTNLFFALQSVNTWNLNWTLLSFKYFWTVMAKKK